MDSKIITYILALIHFSFFFVIPAYISLFSTNMKYLLLVCFFWLCLIFNWYLFGACWLTIIENKNFYKNKYKDKKWSNWYTNEIKHISGKIFGKFIGNLLSKIVLYSVTLTPIIYSIIVYIRIYLIYCNKSVN